MQRVILHCGLHKTGTTAVQSILAEGRDVLLEAGYLYPEYKGQINHNLISKEFRQGMPGPFLKVLKVAADQDKTLLLSGEDFSHLVLERASLALLAKVLSGVDVEFVLALRRQDEIWEAAYAEMVRWNFAKVIDRSPYYELDFEKRLKLIGDYFPHARITCWAHGRSHNTVDEFLSRIGVERERLAVTGRHPSNTRSDRRLTAAMSMFLAVDADTKRAFFDNVEQAGLVEPDGRRSLSTPRMRAGIWRKFRPGNERIAARHPKLADLLIEPHDPDWTPMRRITEDEVRALLDHAAGQAVSFRPNAYYEGLARVLEARFSARSS